ncbi:MAG TPA: LuxR family transcriptional regulator [Rhodospirillaceae bacterium]|nr:LuxR family transcriptional regulator [Rhodospirillaceae bacterium]
MWIDSHCHLTHEKMALPPEQLVNNAKSGGVGGMLNISCQINGDFPDVLATAKKFDNVWCSVGTHPHDAGLETEKSVTLEKLIEIANSGSKIIGIGESGLDYYYDRSPRGDQQESFRKHIRACIETGLPLIVHTRDAEDDTIAIMREEADGKELTGVMHCFSSGPDLAAKALDFGFYISFSGILTFNKSDQLREIAKTVPLERLLVETDAPYLAPVPHRGKDNEPAYVVHTGKFLAELKGISENEMARITTENFFRLFKKAKLS